MAFATVHDRYTDDQIARYYEQGLWAVDTLFSLIEEQAEARPDKVFGNVARGTFVEIEGITQPTPQPKFSRTPAEVDGPPPAPVEALSAWGVTPERIEKWAASGAIAQTATATKESDS